MVPSLTPYDLPFPPKWGFHMPPTYANGHISATAHGAHRAVIFAIAQLSCLLKGEGKRLFTWQLNVYIYTARIYI